MKTIFEVSTLLHLKSDSCLLIKRLLGEERKNISEWISKMDFYSHHREMKARVLSDTGHWFQTRREFQSWIESDQCSLLWLRGNGMPVSVHQMGPNPN